MNDVIVLLTDFGLKDPYVGVMKGVITRINPMVKIIDLTHEITRQDVYEAAITLFVSYKYFPGGSIFVSVVDPGVGSRRRAILIVSRNYYFIGPDNGSLYPAAKDDGVVRVYDVSSSRYILKEVSYTFHGRDVFAPIAAYLSLGLRPEQLGVMIAADELSKILIPEPIVSNEGIGGSIIYVDTFGNLMTNITSRILVNNGVTYGSHLTIRLGGKEIECILVPSFSHVPRGKLACYINSWGYFEIGVNHGSATDMLGINKGADVLIKR